MKNRDQRDLKCLWGQLCASNNNCVEVFAVVIVKHFISFGFTTEKRRARRWIASIEIIMKKNEGQLLSGDQITADHVLALRGSATDYCQQILSFPPANWTINITFVWILRQREEQQLWMLWRTERAGVFWPQIIDVPITLSWKIWVHVNIVNVRSEQDVALVWLWKNHITLMKVKPRWSCRNSMDSHWTLFVSRDLHILCQSNLNRSNLWHNNTVHETQRVMQDHYLHS